ncbi:hypothetical protein WICPIJ_006651 [Wickerhamomyces pijperi]|uniref:Uncharacterized protein n=1 Tax=Wickerhamomyces pijperi TaxID=599730 RepID=A0A9P8Q1Y3_WICPI|nr:hypothetical protein WICPIJ_006651 [Wickerhamomyces pijperi]
MKKNSDELRTLLWTFGPSKPTVENTSTPIIVKNTCTPDARIILRINGCAGVRNTSLEINFQPEFAKVSALSVSIEMFSLTRSTLLLYVWMSLFKVLTSTTPTIAERNATSTKELIKDSQWIWSSLTSPLKYMSQRSLHDTSNSSLQ